MAKLSILIFILAIIIASIHAVPFNFNKLNNRDGDGKIITVVSEDEFCGFLPKTAGQDIGSSEDDAVTFCRNIPTANAPGAQQYPPGFILSAHFYKDDANGFVQVTGRLDNSIYVDPSDGGGQYDIKAPGGASCFGFSRFVSLVEPNNGLYCIRCCNDKKNCPMGKSTDGCEAVIPGDYS
ncbi:6365_t:CDS:1 [Dentiscutata erythropus]|uniref:6365_t:CDS:1 n=1 Tax=Dentiscutata erythropus TaxID=1348616 RepID=A0A9N9ABD9_9GLOM|nr:6365_t:CDS:1 [Dentiscutata erythropus]